MTKGLDKIGIALDIASLTQGCKDLWDNRRTNNAYKVINMLAQVIASGSIFLKGSSGMANVLAATAAYHDIRNDYEKKQPVDKGNLISLTGNIIAIAAQCYTYVPPQLKILSAVVAAAGLGYSYKDKISILIDKYSNDIFKNDINEMKKHFDALGASQPNQSNTSYVENSQSQKLLSLDSFHAMTDEKKLRLLEHAYLQNMQKKSQINPQTPSSIPYLGVEMKQTLDQEMQEKQQNQQSQGKSLT